MVSKKVTWRKILGIKTFQVGDYVKFKWGDLRYNSKWKERKTWCYGQVIIILSEGDEYIVRLMRGSPQKELHAMEEVRLWSPRKK